MGQKRDVPGVPSGGCRGEAEGHCCSSHSVPVLKASKRCRVEPSRRCFPASGSANAGAKASLFPPSPSFPPAKRRSCPSSHTHKVQTGPGHDLGLDTSLPATNVNNYILVVSSSACAFIVPLCIPYLNLTGEALTVDNKTICPYEYLSITRHRHWCQHHDQWQLYADEDRARSARRGVGQMQSAD